MAQKQGTTNERTPGNLGLVRDIPIGQIVIGERLRKVDKDWVDALATSMAGTGQHQPIQVVARGKKFRLIDGAHRIEASKLIGAETIRAEIVTTTPLEERLREIDANLLRRDLNPLDRATFLAARKAVHEEMYPETKAGVAGGKARHGQQATSMSFAKTTAEKIGITPRSIERAVRIHKLIGPAIRDRLHGTKLAESQNELLALADQGPEAQALILDHIDKGDAGSVRAALRIVEGHVKPEAKGAAPDSADKQFQKLFEAWRRANTMARRRFVQEVMDSTFTNDVGDVLCWIADTRDSDDEAA